jgi:hypothetical protein
MILMKVQKKLFILSVVILLFFVIYVYFYPAYQDQKVRSKLSAIHPVIQSCKTLVENAVHMTIESVLSQSLFICDGGVSSGVSIPNFLKSLSINSQGVILVTIDYRQVPELNPYSNLITFTPMISNTVPLSAADVRKNIKGWRCGNLKDGTTIPARYLPSDCIDTSGSL